MELNLSHEKRDVEIWLTRAEKNNAQVRERLKKICAQWKKKGYFVTVFESGDGNLYQDTLGLLSYNKKRTAELEVRRAREETAAEQLSALRVQNGRIPSARQASGKM